MTVPFEGFQQGLMTGATLGGRMRQNRQRQEIGGMLQNQDYAGASQAAYGYGDIQGGSALEQAGAQQAAQQRGTQITGALATGDYDGAMSFASSPEELEAINQFRQTASEQEREAAVRQATDLASVIEAVSSLPPEQQLSAAQQYAPQFGVDPAKITPQTLQQLPALRVQALGLKDYLTYQDRQDDNRRQQTVAEAQIAAAQALADQRRVSAGVAQSREARQSRPSGGSRGSGGSRPAAPAAPARKPWERY